MRGMTCEPQSWWVVRRVGTAHVKFTSSDFAPALACGALAALACGGPLEGAVTPSRGSKGIPLQGGLLIWGT